MVLFGPACMHEDSTIPHSLIQTTRSSMVLDYHSQQIFKPEMCHCAMTFSCEKSLIRHHFVLSCLLCYCPRKETTCPIGFLRQFYVGKVACPQSANGVFLLKNAFIDHTQIVKIKLHNYAPNKSCISESI